MIDFTYAPNLSVNPKCASYFGYWPTLGECAQYLYIIANIITVDSEYLIVEAEDTGAVLMVHLLILSVLY